MVVANLFLTLINSFAISFNPRLLNKVIAESTDSTSVKSTFFKAFIASLRKSTFSIELIYENNVTSPFL